MSKPETVSTFAIAQAGSAGVRGASVEFFKSTMRVKTGATRQSAFVILQISGRACVRAIELPADYPEDPPDHINGTTALAVGLSPFHADHGFEGECASYDLVRQDPARSPVRQRHR